jgi:putative Mg2+ transporter-C (MgtC) family protein
VVQGIGFLGAGTILKLTDRVEVRGLTTAASVWVTASIGVAAALGEIWIAILGTAIAWFALWPLRLLEEALFPDDKKQRKQQKAIAAGDGKPDRSLDNDA